MSKIIDSTRLLIKFSIARKSFKVLNFYHKSLTVISNQYKNSKLIFSDKIIVIYFSSNKIPEIVRIILTLSIIWRMYICHVTEISHFFMISFINIFCSAKTVSWSPFARFLYIKHVYSQSIKKLDPVEIQRILKKCYF